MIDLWMQGEVSDDQIMLALRPSIHVDLKRAADVCLYVYV
jgi:hypothetical protein